MEDQSKTWVIYEYVCGYCGWRARSFDKPIRFKTTRINYECVSHELITTSKEDYEKAIKAPAH